MREKSNLPSPRRQEVVALHQAGLSSRKVAQRLGISQQAVCKHLRKEGLCRPRVRPAQEAPQAVPGSPAAPEAPPPPPVAGPEITNIDEALAVAFKHGLVVWQRGQQFVLEGVHQCPATVQEAFQRWQSDLLFLLKRQMVRHPPCPSCGNQLLLRRNGMVLCPRCYPGRLGPDWVWAAGF